MSVLLIFLACNKTTEPPPKDVNDVTEPAPVEPAAPAPAEVVPEAEPEPADGDPKAMGADEPLMAAWGQACTPMPDGIPKQVSEVEKAFADAGIEATITSLPACKACKMCPTIAVKIDVAPEKRADAEALTNQWMEALSPSPTP